MQDFGGGGHKSTEVTLQVNLQLDTRSTDYKQTVCIQIPTSGLNSLVTLGKLLNLYVTQFLHL